MTDEIKHPTGVVTISFRLFIFMMVTAALIFLALIVFGGYFYTEHVRNKAYLENRASFIEQYKIVQYKLSGTTFCYEPRGDYIREATYKGHGLYRVHE